MAADASCTDARLRDAIGTPAEGARSSVGTQAVDRHATRRARRNVRRRGVVQRRASRSLQEKRYVTLNTTQDLYTFNPLALVYFKVDDSGVW